MTYKQKLPNSKRIKIYNELRENGATPKQADNFIEKHGYEIDNDKLEREKYMLNNPPKKYDKEENYLNMKQEFKNNSYDTGGLSKKEIFEMTIGTEADKEANFKKLQEEGYIYEEKKGKFKRAK